MQENPKQQRKGRKHSVMLMLYDIILLLGVDLLMFVVYPSSVTRLSLQGVLAQLLISSVSILGCRIIWDIYKQIWRYGGTSQYIRLMLADAMAGKPDAPAMPDLFSAHVNTAEELGSEHLLDWNSFFSEAELKKQVRAEVYLSLENGKIKANGEEMLDTES